MEPHSRKRKAESNEATDGNKRAKVKKQWRMPRKDAAEARGIQPGDMGIWATCAMKKEGKSVAELKDLFQDYATKLYGIGSSAIAADDGDSDDDAGDIEAEIKKEVSEIRAPTSDLPFASVRLDTQCLLFFKTRQPIEPVSFIQRICQDAASGIPQKLCRFVKRLTPITAIEKATEKGLDDVARLVLAPHFHGPDQQGKKVLFAFRVSMWRLMKRNATFAIRTSIRNNREFNRDYVIKTVASAVGAGHKVDLTGYDLLILVEIYQNVIGMSVVGPEFEKLRRFNLEELRGPREEATEGVYAE